MVSEIQGVGCSAILRQNHRLGSALSGPAHLYSDYRTCSQRFHHITSHHIIISHHVTSCSAVISSHHPSQRTFFNPNLFTFLLPGWEGSQVVNCPLQFKGKWLHISLNLGTDMGGGSEGLLPKHYSGNPDISPQYLAVQYQNPRIWCYLVSAVPGTASATPSMFRDLQNCLVMLRTIQCSGMNWSWVRTLQAA